MKSYHLLYSRYIQNLKFLKDLSSSYPIKEKSPFGKGTIELFEDGTFFCDATKTEGGPEVFVGRSFSLLTPLGAEKASKIESDGLPELDRDSIKSKILRFRISQSYVDDLSRKTGISTEALCKLPVWATQGSSRISMVQRNQIGQPVNLFQWEYGQRSENITGVPRVEPAPDAKRIWFAENMLIAGALQLKLGEPVYHRPNLKSLDWNDYETLTEGKQVILVIPNEREDWEYSFFPLIKKLRQWKRNFQAIYTDPLTNGSSINKWLEKSENLNYFLQSVADESLQQAVVYDRETYHEFIAKNTSKSMYAPQDMQNNMYWYKLSNGEFVHSWPINVCNAEELLQKHSINVDTGEDPEIRLTKDQVLNISVSAKQNTPKMVYERLKDFIQRYIYLEHPQTASLIALWVMGSYVFQLFAAYAYLHMNGDKNTGKTTLLELIILIAFNGVLESQSTKAKVAEQVNRLGCTLCLDEFESSSLGTGDDYSQMLKGGYKKGGTYSKMSGKGKASRLNTYSPKAIASIDEIGDQALQSRTIPVKTVLMPSDASTQIWDSTDYTIQETARNIRLGCYTMGLYHHRDIQQMASRVQSTIDLPSGEKLSARKRQIVAPLIAIARLIDTNGKAEIESELLKALEIAWYQKNSNQIKYEKLLSETLVKWNHDDKFDAFKQKDHYTWIDNTCWDDTPILKSFETKISFLKWIRSFYGVKIDSTYINKRLSVKSCTGFPDDLNVDGKPFSEWFS